MDNSPSASLRTKFPWPLPLRSSCGSPTQGVPKKLRTLRDWIERKPLRWVSQTVSVLDWRAKGLDAASIGGLWGLAVIAEIALFAVSARFPQRIGSLGLIGVGAFGAVLRWGVMSFNPPLMLLPMLQLLHAFSFGATHLGSMQLLARRAPARQFATAQGDFATVLALVMAGGMALSGALYADLGDRAYAAMALAAALGGVLVLLARGRVTQPRR